MTEREERYLALIEHNRGRIGRLCRAWARTTDDFEDLRSEVYFQLWRSLPSFDGRASEDTWLFRVALNVVFQSGRRAHRKRDFLERLSREPATGETPPADRFEDNGRLERLRAAVMRLPQAERALVTLSLEELTHQQIADALGLSVGNVAVKLHRIRKRLAEDLTQEEIAHGRQ